MSSEAVKLLQQFDQLPLQEQKELSAAILKRTATFDYEEPSDEELTAAAARVFEVLDQEENDAASRRSLAGRSWAGAKDPTCPCP